MLGNQIVRGIGWMMVGRVVSNLLGVISTLVVAAMLIPKEMGIFALANSVAMIVMSVFELQTSLLLVQMKDPQKQDFDTVFTINLIRGVFLALIMLAVAWPFAHAFNEPETVPLLLALSIYPILLSIRNPYFELHAKEVKFAPQTFVEIATKVGSFVGTVGVALIHPSYWALYAGVILSAITSSVINFGFSKQLPGFSLKSFYKVFSFSIWIALAGVTHQLNKQSDRLILGSFFGTALLGAFAMAAQVLDQIMNVMIQPINWAVYSGFSKINDDKERLRRSYLLAQAGMAAILLPASVGLLFVVDNLVLVLMGEKWRGAIIFAQFSAAYSFLRLWPGPSWSLGMALGKTKLLFWRTVIAVAFRIGVQLAGILMFGLYGFLIGGVIAEIVGNVITLTILKQICGLRRVDVIRASLRPILACLVMGGYLLTLRWVVMPDADNWVQLLVEVGSGGFVYLLASWILWRMAGMPEGHESRALSIGTKYLEAAHSKILGARA